MVLHTMCIQPPYTFPLNQQAMEEADSQKQRRIFPRSSIQRKPFSNLTTEPHRHSISSSRSKKRISSTAAVDPYMSDSSTGSTVNRNRVQHLSTVPTKRHSPATPPTPSPDDWVGDGNHMACSRRQTMMTTNSKTKAASVPDYPFHLEKSMNIKENVHIPHAGVNTHEINGKPIVVQRNCTPVKNINNDAKVVLKPHFTRKMNGKGNEINVPPRHPSVENTNMDSLVRLKFKDNGKAFVVGSSPVTLSKKYKVKEVVTPINFGALKKAKGYSSEPLMRNRSEAEGAEDALQTKSLTYPPSNNKKRKCSSKGRFKKFVLPQDYIDQQKAYFKEIDEYELDVEEVE